MIVLANQTVDFNTPPVPFVVTSNIGFILRTGSVPDEATGNLQAQVGEYVFAGTANQEVQYVTGATGNTPEAFNRPAAANISIGYHPYGPGPREYDTVTYFDVTNNSLVYITDPSGIVHSTTADGTDYEGNAAASTALALRLDMVGTYFVRISSWPSLDYTHSFLSELPPY